MFSEGNSYPAFSKLLDQNYSFISLTLNQSGLLQGEDSREGITNVIPKTLHSTSFSGNLASELIIWKLPIDIVISSSV